ncbi:F-box domain containing protein [Tanacetum coccineum]
MNRLPVKSLLQFRTVSKLWKYSIDCSDFVREYGFRESNNCCLYLTFKQNFEGVICSVDDNLALSPVVSNLKFFNLTPFATCEGVWCFSYGENSMLLIWNPSLKKSVRISVPNYLLEADSPKMLFGFGVHPVTLDPTLLKINYPYYGQGPWSSPAEHELKLIGFSKDKQPIVEAAIFQQWHQSLQVFNPSIQSFQNVGVEANHGSFFIGQYKESLMLVNEQSMGIIF